MEALDAPGTPPGNYAEWCAWVDALALGTCDSDLLSLARKSGTTWTAAVAQMFGARVHEALNARLNGTGRNLERRLTGCRSETALTLALVQGRQELLSIGRFAEIATFPEAVRESLRALVRRHLDERQAALERSALVDRTGRLSLAVRRSPLNQAPIAGDGRSPHPDAFATAPGAGRRVILDQGC